MFKLIDELHLSGQSWLDAGCGTGTLSRMLADRGCRVEGVDASAEMIGIAIDRTRSEARSKMLSFRQIDTIESMPFASSSLDGVLCSSVLEYTASPGKCLAEISRVLRAEGLLLLSIPNRNSLLRKLFKLVHRALLVLADRPVFRYLQFSRFEGTIVEVTDLLRPHGLTVLDYNFTGSPLPPILNRQRAFGTLINILARRDRR